MNPLYSTAAASSPIICRRIAAKATTTSITTSSPSLTTIRHAGHISKVAARAQEIQAAKAAALAAASSSTSGRGNTLNGPGTPGSADRLMAKIIESRGPDITPAERQKLELRLLKMKMSRKQYMKWLKAHPQNPITIPNTKLVMPEGHGENIWLWHHTEAGHVVYSLHPQMDSNKALAQFPYTGKKLVPPKLRRDYWAPFLQIQFPSGQGEIGRSVWQKLLELKKRHELEWGDEVRQEYYRMSREERGRALNDQRANVIADIAAVLGGLGKGNKIVLPEKKSRKGAVLEEKEKEVEPELCAAKVFWTNARDRFYAASWSGNITHWVGLPGKDVESVQLDVVEPEPVVEEKEAKEGEQKEGEVKEGEVEGEGKKVKEGEAAVAGKL